MYHSIVNDVENETATYHQPRLISDIYRTRMSNFPSGNFDSIASGYQYRYFFKKDETGNCHCWYIHTLIGQVFNATSYVFEFYKPIHDDLRVQEDVQVCGVVPSVSCNAIEAQLLQLNEVNHYKKSIELPLAILYNFESK